MKSANCGNNRLLMVDVVWGEEDRVKWHDEWSDSSAQAPSGAVPRKRERPGCGDGGGRGPAVLHMWGAAAAPSGVSRVIAEGGGVFPV